MVPLFHFSNRENTEWTEIGRKINVLQRSENVQGKDKGRENPRLKRRKNYNAAQKICG